MYQGALSLPTGARVRFVPVIGRRRSAPRSGRIAVAALLALGGCTGKTTVVREPATAALIPALPADCRVQGRNDAEIAFVARDAVWAVRADGSGLGCLFPIRDAGLFEWGPKADRVVTDGLEVRSAGGSVLRPAGKIDPVALAWGHPTGKSLVFVDPRASGRLQKAAIGGSLSDITPLKDVTYTGVEYHPSGLAIAFAVEGKDINAIWLSSNTGKNPKRLVASTKGTRFGALHFEEDGQTLTYAATLSDGTSRLGRYFLTAGDADEGLWVGPKPILRFAREGPGPGIAFDIGTGCPDRRAIYSQLDKSEGVALLPDAAEPTTVLGRLAGTKFLVAAGGCDGPYDLWVAEAGGTPALLVRSVDQGAVRIPEPGPPPDLPQVGVSSRFF